ncbi:MAG: hypothetical protein U7127_13225 [Phormidium sp.]|uniref:Uncharacterized protein n=1 Tax=Floridaenema flaviceps BLCC-F50 TaxID=3153642 RepID=A0ABV4Y2K0_9CYAN
MNEQQSDIPSNPHIEVKNKYLYGQEVDDIINKKNVIGVVNGKNISGPGKTKLEKAGIAYAENVPESEFMESEDQEEG